MGFIRRTNEEWLELYEQQRASGMYVKDWCAANEIKLPTMVDRITRLRKMGLIKEPKPARGKKDKPYQSREKKTWVEVTTAPEAFSEGDRNATNSANISVSIGNYMVQVQKGFEAEVLAEVCRVLVAL